MPSRRLKIARLDEEDLNKVRAMEEAYGTTVVALEAEYPVSQLSEDQLAKVQSLESELNVALVAYPR